MSLNDFNKQVTFTIGVEISGSGQFSPFEPTYGIPMNWTIEGRMQMKSVDQNATLRDETCGGIDLLDPAYFLSWNAPGSVGSNSGTIEFGYYKPKQPAIISNTTFGGIWKFNTDPVLSAGGKVNGENAKYFYIVQRPPEVETVDDPILIDPPIDGLKRIYEGDLIYVNSGVWNVSPQNRFPKTDRTFFWEPNTQPVLKAGGIIDDKLAKPGTIMLPDEDYYIAKQSDGFDGMRYFYENQGVMFDGQIWSKLSNDPLVYKKDEETNEFRDLNVSYISQQNFVSRLEELHQNKGQVIGYIPIDYEEAITFTETPEEGDPIVTDFFFYWMSPQAGIIDNAIPATAVRYDFKDAWSKYYASNATWLKERPKIAGAFLGAGFFLKSKAEGGNDEQIINLSVNFLEDGNKTKIEDKIKNAEGTDLVNTFNITTSITLLQT
jgi:hypothetical protein